MAHTVELTKMDGTTVTVTNVDPSEPLVVYGIGSEQEHDVKMTDTSNPPVTVITGFVGPAPKK